MNDEIREILKILKKCEFGACITKHNSRVLLDYITNLQKENERLKFKVNSWQSYSYELEDYKSRVEKAVEYVNTWVCDEYSIAIQDPNDECFCSTEPNAVDNLLNILQNGSDDNEKN